MSEGAKMYDRLALAYQEAVLLSAKLTELAVDLQAVGAEATARRYATQALRSSELASGLWEALLGAQGDVLAEPPGAERPGAE